MRTVKGLGSIESISEVLDCLKLKKILIVSGKNSFKNSGAEKALKRLLVKFELHYFNDFTSNPKLSDALKGVDIAEKFGLEAIIAIGGGSVIDMSKLIKGFLYNSSEALNMMKGKAIIKNSKIPLIAIPTTAGTGSEETHFAVVYDDDKKYSLAAKFLRPNYVILDGNLALSKNKYQKACNVLDSISQSIESTWSINSTKQSRKISLKALKKSMEHYFDFVNKNKNYEEISQNMLEAANLSGKSIDLTKTTAAHAWSYGFTSQLNLPHGHAVWMTLPKIFVIHSNNGNILNDDRGENFVSQTMQELQKVLEISDKDSIEKTFLDLLSSISVNIDFDKFDKLTNNKRIELSKSANLQRMKNNPIQFTQKQIEWIFNIK